MHQAHIRYPHHQYSSCLEPQRCKIHSTEPINIKAMLQIAVWALCGAHHNAFINISEAIIAPDSAEESSMALARLGLIQQLVSAKQHRK